MYVIRLKLRIIQVTPSQPTSVNFPVCYFFLLPQC